ncbi:MAG: hypothetical protein HN478_07305 [Rhodospirillaceae bacterium]|jgi:hypothetical protein|nr:hypothetical protein [Rhodospirillaceae bacterium]MBT4489682.1 hypothetical protein [Rhodospirillaceae bacterium]MBT5191954.1 hypothetical protein [Rhodospirillaceae bacterium]MBT5896449.1 hypothetical protein [Rhodospirillaceae bacterium]MBT6426944.1 hypothetical protein [Rhodospirillaceae bacterium]
MKREGSLGLMAFWADIDADYLLRFQEWHNCEHIPERISVPGFNVGRRYRGIGEAPGFLMFYETDTASTFASAPYLARLNDPTPWTQESLPHFQNPSRNIYALQSETGQVAPIEAPYIHTLRFNGGDGMEAWLATIAARDNVHRARIYAVDEDISNIMTSERQIYGGGPGQQQYLAMLECAAPLADLQPPDGVTDLFSDGFWLEIALYPEMGQ